MFELSLFAVHLSDWVLVRSWCGAGFGLAVLLMALALRRIHEEEIPRIGLLAAAFFIASSIHIRIGPSSVHLLLNGLVGVVLGKRAPLAIGMGLLLQVALLGHGGYTTWGLNLVVLALPALLARQGFRALRKRTRPFALGVMVGAGTVILTAALNAWVLVFAGVEDWRIVATMIFVAHLPVAVIEGVVLGFTVAYLEKVKPELLR